MGSVRSEQTAALVVFSVTGLVSATWAARIPDTQAQLNLSMGQLALAVLAIEGGALLGLPAGGALVSRLGSRWSLWLGLAIYPTMLAPLAIAPSLGWLAGLLVIWAGANSLVDVAMNAAGVELEGSCAGRCCLDCMPRKAAACSLAAWPRPAPRPDTSRY